MYENMGKKKSRGKKREYTKRLYKNDLYLLKSKIVRFFYKR